MKNTWIIKATYFRDYQLELEFNDGSYGIVDLSNQLNKPIFQPLKNIDYFKNFKLNSWTISWDNGADFAPEFLRELIEINVKQKDV